MRAPTSRRTHAATGARPRATEFSGLCRRGAAPRRHATPLLPRAPGFPASTPRHDKLARLAMTDRHDRLPRHAQPARHAVPDARRPAQARAGLGQGVGRQGPLQAAARRAPRRAEVRAARRPAVRQRRHPHRPRGQQDPEGHDRQGAPARRLRRALRAGLGLPRPADRERRSRRSTAATCRATRCRPSAAPTPPSRSRSRRPTSSAWACSATGTIRTARWTTATRPTRSARFKRVIEHGFVYRGLKPVNWCFDCGSSLAEAEIEYADKRSPTLDVGFTAAEPDEARRRLRPAGARRRTSSP